MTKTSEIKFSIIGDHQIIGLEDMIKDAITYRKSKVECISDKAVVYFLNKEVIFLSDFVRITSQDSLSKCKSKLLTNLSP